MTSKRQCKCGKSFRISDLLVYFFNYFDSYINCSVCKKETEVGRPTGWIYLVLKVSIYLLLIFLAWSFLSQGMFPEHNGEHAEYYSSYMGQMYGGVREYPLINVIYIAFLSILSASILVVPINRIINWVAKINGKPTRLDVDPNTPLLWAVREQAGLTGTKFGCGMAMCGACTMLPIRPDHERGGFAPRYAEPHR